jgi:DNA-binding transcriptional MerR regulator/methylmalonyl-CoA mutase cobalamin-binding subunit
MNKDTAPRHPIRVAAQRTGLTPATLRAWERRYGVVEPERSDGGQRLYSDLDIDRLTRLRLLTEAGRSISQVAELSDQEAKALLAEDQEASTPESHPGGFSVSPDRMVDTAFHFVQTMNDRELEYTLRRAVVTLGAGSFLEHVLTPLLHRIGEAWVAEELKPGQEHLATQVVERVLGWLIEPMSAKARGPKILVATLPDERHGLGVKLAAATAAIAGWQVCDMGVDLPVEEVAEGARTLDARVVALSLVNRAHNGDATSALQILRGELPESVRVVVGGAAAQNLDRSALPDGIEVLGSLEDLRKSLNSAR